MKKFILSILCAAIFFIGLGGLIQETGARFKSDERALDLIKQAQTAIGGEENLRQIKSLSIAGNLSKTFDIDGASRIEQGELEINLALPGQFAKKVKLGSANNSAEAKSVEVEKRVSVVVMNSGGDNAIFKQAEPNGENQGVLVFKRGEGDKIVLNNDKTNSEAGKILFDKDFKINGGSINFQNNEMFRMTLALLLTTPQGTDATFTYVGELDVDGNLCDIVEAKNGDFGVKLFLDKTSHLVRMLSYQGFKPLIFKFNKNDNSAENREKLIVNNFPKSELAEIQIRFSDYRTVNGVLLPYRWTQTIGGNADETIDVSNYEVNPANIVEKFNNAPQKIMIRTAKPQ